MRKLISGLVIVSIAVLAGCQTAHGPVAPNVAAPGRSLPYRWTPRQCREARGDDRHFPPRVACARRLRLGREIPAEGDPKIIIDLLTQTAYAYKGDVLVGAASVSSAKTGRSPRSASGRCWRSGSVPLEEVQQRPHAIHAADRRIWHRASRRRDTGFPPARLLRMPMKFAEKLFGLTKLGTEVVIEGKALEDSRLAGNKQGHMVDPHGRGSVITTPLAFPGPSDPDGSAADEVRLPLLEERCDAFAIIFGKAEAAHRVALTIKFLVERVAPARADHLLDGGKA